MSYLELVNNNGKILAVDNAKTGYSLSHQANITPLTMMTGSLPTLTSIGGSKNGEDIIFIDIPISTTWYSCTGQQGTSGGALVDNALGFGNFWLLSSSASSAVPFKVFTPHVLNTTPVVFPSTHGIKSWDATGNLTFSSEHEYLDVKFSVSFTLRQILQAGSIVINLPSIPADDSRKYWVSANSLTRDLTVGFSSGRTEFSGTAIRKLTTTSYEVVTDYLCLYFIGTPGLATPTNYLSLDHNVIITFTLL